MFFSTDESQSANWFNVNWEENLSWKDLPVAPKDIISMQRASFTCQNIPVLFLAASSDFSVSPVWFVVLTVKSVERL